MMIETLTSLKNPKVMTWKSLQDRKGRRETGCFLVEGRKMTQQALASSYPVESILISETFRDELSIPADLPVYKMPEHVFASICETKAPQGIAAVVRMTSSTQGIHGKLLALDGVQDPGNVGTIIRTADCAGFDGILLSAQCADPFSPKVLRSTMGSIFRMPVEIVQDLPARLSAYRASGYSILSSQLDGSPFYERTNVSSNFILIIGNEGNGVSPQVSALATHRLKLPMRGGAESLNAAIAAGIMMYELTREL